MRPISLKIKGLNSFIEEQTIDFNRLTDRGFFGIFGPTGSGKSTILDGITLALYGDLARKSSNYININCEKSNVSFKFQISGVEKRVYLVVRDFKRDKKTGNPRIASAKLLDITDGNEEVLADKATLVTKMCEEIIGLSLDDFTRTVVLPQGKFSEFLKLEGKNRREMLERLFSLREYGDDLTIKLSKRISNEKEKNSELLGELRGFENVSEEGLKEKEDNLEDIRHKSKLSKAGLDKLQEEFKEVENIWNLQKELKEFREEKNILEEKKEHINSINNKINLAESALKLEPYVNSYEKTIKGIEEVEKNIIKLNSNLEILNKQKEKWKFRYDNWKNKKDEELPELVRKEEKIKDALEEEKYILKLEKEVECLEKEDSKLREKYRGEINKLNSIKANANKCREQVREGEQEIEKLVIDEKLKMYISKGIILEEKSESLLKQVSDYKEKLESLKKKIKVLDERKIVLCKKLDNKREEFINKENELKEILSSYKDDDKDLLDFQMSIQKGREYWNKYNVLNEENKNILTLMDNINSELNDLKELRKSKTRNLEDISIKLKDKEIASLSMKIRESLKDSDICPVCGGKEHHFDRVEFKDISGLEVLQEETKKLEEHIKKLETEITIKETKLITEKEKFLKNNDEISSLGEDFKSINVEELEKEFIDLKRIKEEFKLKKETLENELVSLREEKYKSEKEVGEINSVLSENKIQLHSLNDDYEKKNDELNLQMKELVILKEESKIISFKEKNLEILKLEKERENKSKRVKEFRMKLEELINNGEILQQNITKLIEKGTETASKLKGKRELKKEKEEGLREKFNEEKPLAYLLKETLEKITDINKNFKESEEMMNLKDKMQREENDKLIQALGKERELRNRESEERETLEEELKKEGFRDVLEVKNNIITLEEIKSLKNIVEEYKERVSKVTGAIESILRKISNKEVSEEKWQDINEEIKRMSEEFKYLSEEEIRISEEYKNFKLRLESLGELLKKKERLQHKLALLGDLEKLFKGKKFVEFVATTRLKYVSIEASKRLKDITNGNYGLEIDDNGKFIIRDFKNGGAKRDASTLSGGETFIVSLALALALSAQIQLKGTAPLELFFLDEGFGTLDDSLLETVMSSLERIHNDKLKVGIISHVESIKNRVPVKLILTPAESGRGGSKVKIERS